MKLPIKYFGPSMLQENCILTTNASVDKRSFSILFQIDLPTPVMLLKLPITLFSKFLKFPLYYTPKVVWPKYYVAKNCILIANAPVNKNFFNIIISNLVTVLLEYINLQSLAPSHGAVNIVLLHNSIVYIYINISFNLNVQKGVHSRYAA